MELAVGKDIYSVCGKCGDVWHVVVSMDKGKVTKVQCKHCSGYHRYKAPEGEVDVNKKKKVAKKSTKKAAKKTTRAKRKTAKIDVPLIEPDMSKPIRGYAMAETYEPGERIEHPKFGQGVVESAPGPGKMNVFFEDGRKTLAQGRGAPPPA